MVFKLLFTDEAKSQLNMLAKNNTYHKRYKAVLKCLSFLEQNPRHSGLNTHKYNGIKGSKGEDVFEAYAENNTPGAYRVFWMYGPNNRQITILAITPHP